MSIPGLPAPIISADYDLTYASSVNDVDVHADAGSPASAVDLSILILPGVVIGSTSTGSPAFDVSGLPSGSTVTLYKSAAKVQGMGGAGGIGYDGDFDLTPTLERGGGGGGGAGTNPGAGGTANAPATAGAVGTSAAGGAAGLNGTHVSVTNFQAGSFGGDGGDAIKSGSIALTIFNSGGQIWGGGGGGAAGVTDTAFPAVDTPKAGGGPGAAPVASSVFPTSTPGNAVRGSNVTFLSGGSSPNVEGAVST